MPWPALARPLIAAGLVCALLLSGAAAACGGEGGGNATSTPPSGGTPQGTAGSSLTVQEYFQRVAELNDRVSAELDTLNNQIATALPTDQALEALRASIEQYASIYQELRDGLQQLSPPVEVQAAHQEAFDALTAFIDYSHEMSAKAQDARDVVDIAAIIDSAQTRTVNGRLTDACEALRQAAATASVTIELACGE